jgi:PPP family 3-phenylpropionic acid transporter
MLYVLAYASSAAWIFQFNVYLEVVGFKGAHIGYVASLIWLVMLVFQPAWGVWADRTGVVKCFQITVVMTTLTLTGFYFFGTTPTTAIIATLICSFFYVPVMPLIDSVALAHIERTKKLSYGNLRFWGAVGFGLGGPLAGKGVEMGSANSIFLIAAGLSALAIPLSFRLSKSERVSSSFVVATAGLREVLRDRAVQVFLLFITLASVFQSTIWFYLAVYMKEIGASAQMTGWAPSVEAYSELPFYFLSAIVFRRFGVLPALLATTLLASVRVWLYSTTDNPWLVLVIEASNGITWTWFWLASVEFANQLIRPEWRATGQSLLWAAYQGAGAILGNWWCGWLYGREGNMRSVFAVNGLISIGISLLAIILVWTKYHRRSVPTPLSPTALPNS